HPQVTLGASPRAGVHLMCAAKAHAVLAGRAHVEPEDMRAVLMPVWRHRLHLSPQALSRGASAGELLDQVLRTTTVTCDRVRELCCGPPCGASSSPWWPPWPGSWPI